MSEESSNRWLHDTAIEERGGELVNPYLIYEMALGSGLPESEARKEMRLYCLEVGLDPQCP